MISYDDDKIKLAKIQECFPTQLIILFVFLSFVYLSDKQYLLEMVKQFKLVLYIISIFNYLFCLSIFFE